MNIGKGSRSEDLVKLVPYESTELAAHDEVAAAAAKPATEVAGKAALASPRGPRAKLIAQAEATAEAGPAANAEPAAPTLAAVEAMKAAAQAGLGPVVAGAVDESNVLRVGKYVRLWPGLKSATNSWASLHEGEIAKITGAIITDGGSLYLSRDAMNLGKGFKSKDLMKLVPYVSLELAAQAEVAVAVADAAGAKATVTS